MNVVLLLSLIQLLNLQQFETILDDLLYTAGQEFYLFETKITLQSFFETYKLTIILFLRNKFTFPGCVISLQK